MSGLPPVPTTTPMKGSSITGEIDALLRPLPTLPSARPLSDPSPDIDLTSTSSSMRKLPQPPSRNGSTISPAETATTRPLPTPKRSSSNPSLPLSSSSSDSSNVVSDAGSTTFIRALPRPLPRTCTSSSSTPTTTSSSSSSSLQRRPSGEVGSSLEVRLLPRLRGTSTGDLPTTSSSTQTLPRPRGTSSGEVNSETKPQLLRRPPSAGEIPTPARSGSDPNLHSSGVPPLPRRPPSAGDITTSASTIPSSSSSSLVATPGARPRGMTTSELPRPNFGKWVTLTPTPTPTPVSQPQLPQPAMQKSVPIMPLTRPRGLTQGSADPPPRPDLSTLQRPVPILSQPSTTGLLPRLQPLLTTATSKGLPPEASPSSTLISLVPSDSSKPPKPVGKYATMPRSFVPKVSGFEAEFEKVRERENANLPSETTLPALPSRAAPLPRIRSEEVEPIVTTSSYSDLTTPVQTEYEPQQPQRKGSRVGTPLPPLPPIPPISSSQPTEEGQQINLHSSQTLADRRKGSKFQPFNPSPAPAPSPSPTPANPLSPTPPRNIPQNQAALVQELQNKQKGSRFISPPPTLGNTQRIVSISPRPTPAPPFDMEDETPPPLNSNTSGSSGLLGTDSEKEQSYLSLLMRRAKGETAEPKKEETNTGRWIQDDTGEWQQLLRPALIKVLPTDFQEEEFQGALRRRCKGIYVVDEPSQTNQSSILNPEVQKTDFRRSRRSTMICPSIEPEENDDNDPESNYLAVTQDPRYQRLLLKYAPDLCTQKGLRQRVKNYVDPASIPVFNMICRSYRACRLMYNVKQIGKLENTINEGGLGTNSFVSNSVEHMGIGLKVETAGQTTDAMVTTVFTCMPFTYIIPGFGIVGSVMSTVLAAGVKVAVGESLSVATKKTTKAAISEKPENETDASAFVRQAQEDYGETKALLLYLGLPKTDDKLYEMWEKARISLKVLYGAKPDEDLKTMEPQGELEEALKHAELHDDKYDMAGLSAKFSGISLLLMLWRVYQCWKILYYDRARTIAEKRQWISISADERDRLQDERYVYELLHPLPSNVELMENRDRLHEITALLMEEPYGSWCPSGSRASFLFKDPMRPTTEELAHLRWFVRGLVKFWLTCAEIYIWLDLQYDSKLVAVLLWEPPEADLNVLFSAFLRLYSIKGYVKFGFLTYNQLSSRILAEEQIRTSQIKSEGRRVYGALHYFSSRQHKLAHVDSVRAANEKVPAYYAFDSPMQKLILSVVTYINQPSYATVYTHNSPQKRVLICADFKKIEGSAGDFLVFRYQSRGPVTHTAPGKPLPSVPAPSPPQWKRVTNVPALPPPYSISSPSSFVSQVNISEEQPGVKWKHVGGSHIIPPTPQIVPPSPESSSSSSTSSSLASFSSSLQTPTHSNSTPHSPTAKRSGKPLHAATSPQLPRLQN